MRSVVDWRRKQTAGDRRQTTDSSEAGAGNATPEPTESTAHGSRRIAQGRDAPHHEADESAPPETQAPAQTESADPDAGAGLIPGSSPGTAPTDPPIEPPRSWTRDEKERFKSFAPRNAEYLASRE